jgi:hypothetical protein
MYVFMRVCASLPGGALLEDSLLSLVSLLLDVACEGVRCGGPTDTLPVWTLLLLEWSPRLGVDTDFS